MHHCITAALPTDFASLPGLVTRPFGRYNLAFPGTTTELPVFLTEHLPSRDFRSLFHALARNSSPHELELTKLVLDCLIQLCILKLACQKRNILFDHRDFLPKNILVKQAATQAVLLPPGADSHDRSYNTSYVFLMTDFDSTCVRKLHSDANSRARAAVSESTVNESTILIVVDECTDSEEAGFFYAEDFRTFVGWIFHASSGFRCHDDVCHKEYADDRECAKLRPMRRVLVTLVSQLFQLKNTRAHADLVNKWVDGDIDGVAVVTLFTHFFTHRGTYLDGLSEQTNPLQRLLDSAFVAYKMIE